MNRLLPVFREYGRLERLREGNGLSVEQLERWNHLKRMLASHFRPCRGREFADKQASLRVPVQIRAGFESDGERRECPVKNISRGGLFVSTRSPLPAGSHVELEIRVGETGEVHTLRGEVARVVDAAGGPDGDAEEEGMGIRFTDLDEAQLRVVDRLYDDAMDRAIEKMEG